MKILYAAGRLSGANSRASRFLEHVDSKDEVRVAAYIRKPYLTMIHWTLDAVKHTCQRAELEASLIKWQPDVIVNDFEPLTARLAVEQGIWL